MTSTADPKVYDENSVFKKLFSEQKTPRQTTKAERMQRLFTEVITAEAPIQVKDFLPRY